MRKDSRLRGNDRGGSTGLPRCCVRNDRRMDSRLRGNDKRKNIERIF